MAREPMDVLLTIRQRSVDQARQALAVRLQAETLASAAAGAIDDAILQERRAADRGPRDQQGVEMLAAWLQRMRPRRAAAHHMLSTAAAQTAAARAELAAARSAARAVERLLEERAAAAQVEAEKREQHALDDVARTRHVAQRAEFSTRPDSVRPK